MPGGNTYAWKRFWCPREGSINLGDGGYLADPDARYGSHFNPALRPFGEVSRLPCLALLGEPGIGKTETMKAEQTAIDAAVAAEGGDTIDVETQGRTTPVRLIGVDTPETVDSEQPIGCYGPEASEYTKQILYERQTDDESRVLREGRLVRLEILRIGDSEDAYGRTLAYVYVDTDGDGRYEHSFNEDLIELGLARTTDFSHEHRREFERLREQAEERGAGLWGVCSKVEGYLGVGYLDKTPLSGSMALCASFLVGKTQYGG